MVQTETSSQKSSQVNMHQVLQEERYLWMARAFVVMTVLAVICDIILLIALANVTPVLRVQPFYFTTQNKEQQVLSVSRPDFDVLNSDYIKESLVRQYLMAYFGVGSDLNELQARWSEGGSVYWMSDRAVYMDFIKAPENGRRGGYARQVLDIAEKDNFTRDVRVMALNPVKTGVNGSDVWQADLEFKDMDRASTQPRTSRWNVNVQTTFRTLKELSWRDRLKNPLGFTVVNIGYKEKKE